MERINSTQIYDTHFVEQKIQDLWIDFMWKQDIYEMLDEIYYYAKKNNITTKKALNWWAKTRSFYEEDFQRLKELVRSIFWLSKINIEKTKQKLAYTLNITPQMLADARKHEKRMISTIPTGDD